MLTCMRVRRQLWGQWRRSGVQRRGEIGAIFGRGGGGGRKEVLVPVFGDGAGLGFRGGAQRGYASSEAGPSAVPGGKELPGNGLEGRAGGGLAGLPESPDGDRGFLVRSGAVLVAGAGTIALLGVIAASTDAFSAVPDAKARVKSSSSAVLSSGAGIGRELMKMAGNVKDASIRSFVDFVEAVASIWVLARCVSTILASSVDNASSEVASWWRPRVASFLADLAAHETRRKAIVESGDGLVLDWLLKAVGGSRPACQFTQAEASRALAYLLSDVNTAESVLGRPHALPYLLHFAASIHVNDAVESLSSGRKDQGTPEGRGVSRGKSLLVAAIMDLVTSSCEIGDAGSCFRPMLPGKADPADVAAVLQVVEGGWVVDDDDGSGDKDGNDRGGMQGLGIRVLGGIEIVGVQRMAANLRQQIPYTYFEKIMESFTASVWPQKQHLTAHLGWAHGENGEFQPVESKRNVSSFRRKPSSDSLSSSYGLWDDLPGRFVAVPLAAWALATWAQSSSENRSIIKGIDKEGDALLAAVVAPERSVRWHGAMAMKYLLQNVDKEYDEVAARWTSALLEMAAQATTYKDMQLASLALTSFASCISQSQSARTLVMDEGLPMLRELAKLTERDESVQGALAQSLDVLTSSGSGLSVDEGKRWSPILLRWVCIHSPESLARSCGCRVLNRVVNSLGQVGIPISQAWLAMLLMDIVNESKPKLGRTKGTSVAEAKERGLVQTERVRLATAAAADIAKVVAREAEASAATELTGKGVAESARELPMVDLLGFDMSPAADHPKDSPPKVTAREAASSTLKAVKALTELIAEDEVGRQRVLEAGGLCLLRRLLLCDDFDQWAAAEEVEALNQNAANQTANGGQQEKPPAATPGIEPMSRTTAHIQKHSMRLLATLSLHPSACIAIAKDPEWCAWLESCARGDNFDNKVNSHARAVLYHVSQVKTMMDEELALSTSGSEGRPNLNAIAVPEKIVGEIWPRYEDCIFLMNSDSTYWGAQSSKQEVGANRGSYLGDHVVGFQHDTSYTEKEDDGPVLDVVFVHGLMGGPYRTWRIAEDKTSSTSPSGLVEKIDEDAGKEGTCWPEEWLADDLPGSRLLTVKYKTNLSQWSGATLPLQEVSSILLDKLVAAGIGERPVVFVTHSMGGLVVKQLLVQASQDEKRHDDRRSRLLRNTSGIVFYSCPHFGSKLADMPWRFGYVLRPAPSIGDLRSGSPKLEELNRFVRQLHTKRGLDVLSFSETKVTPLVEGYGGYGLRMEVVPIESAYPGFGELVLLEGTDHINSCKPLCRSDPAYTRTLGFLQKMVAGARETKHKEE
ncbi:hypothetical protein KC19_2G175600 [Ceratodon purpureus]|uniref:Protein SERAC1 n=1 Tax=Ceratodon purpureus TaxID=3225 RepID=A0A8T0IV36_CERPU|nr:hypothetical protein KC19_2G175600 [Ceratodon purpureus]